MGRDGLLSKGHAGILVLGVLQDAPRHGYDIAREVERRSDRRLSFSYGTLYPVLHSLEQDGLIDSQWERPAGERERKVYSINEKGLAELERKRAEWRAYANAIDQVLGPEGA